MEAAKSTADEVRLSAREIADAHTRKLPMEAYMLTFDLAIATQAEADRSAAQYDPLGRWLLESGGGNPSRSNG
jgi:hypothetical protein